MSKGKVPRGRGGRRQSVLLPKRISIRRASSILSGRSGRNLTLFHLRFPSSFLLTVICWTNRTLRSQVCTVILNQVPFFFFNPGKLHSAETLGDLALRCHLVTAYLKYSDPTRKPRLAQVLDLTQCQWCSQFMSVL